MHAVGRSTGRRSVARLGGLAAGLLVALGAPAVVAAHNLGTVYQSPLPLAVYLAGAATTVALSFVFVLARDMRAAPTPPGRVVHVPAALRTVLRVVGLIGWVWIVAQGIAGGTSEASVATLFLWVYGWVGVAILSALLAPGVGVGQPVRDDLRRAAPGRCGRSASAAGASPSSRPSCGCGRRWSGSCSSSGSSSSRSRGTGR